MAEQPGVERLIPAAGGPPDVRHEIVLPPGSGNGCHRRGRNKPRQERTASETVHGDSPRAILWVFSTCRWTH